MKNRSSDNLALRRYFLQLQPVNAAHRQYEALRAFLVEGLPSEQAALRFGYSPGSFRVLVHNFRRDPGRAFFLPDRPPGRKRPETRRQRILALRKQNLSLYDSIADGIDFFHMDALSSAVAIKVDLDLQLTLLASGLYRLLAGRIAHGYERAKSRRLFDDFVDATAAVSIGPHEIAVRFQKRSHNPLLLAAGFEQTNAKVPWLGGRRLRFTFG